MVINYYIIQYIKVGEEKMKMKIIGILICILLIVTAIVPVAMSLNVCRSYDLLQGVIDQYQDERDSDEDVNEYAWQEFVPTGENLLSVEVKIRLGFLWPSNLFLSIEKPLGTVLTSTSLPSQDIPWERSDWVTFDLPDIPLVRGEKYYIVLSHEPGGTYKWSGAWGDLYSQGESSKDLQWDWCFRTIVDKSREKNNEGNLLNQLMLLLSRNRAMQTPFLNYLENYPILYQILQRFLQL